MSLPSKKEILISFSKSAKNYQQNAILQKKVAENLASKLSNSLKPNFILDAGSGSGFSEQILRTKYPNSLFIATDFSLKMLQNNQSFFKVCADIEELSFLNDIFDLYWANLSWQWCTLPNVINEAKRCLKKDGYIAVAGLLNGTFKQINQAFATINSKHQHTLDFPTYDTISRLITNEHREIILEHETINCYFADLPSLFSSIRDIGANQLGNNRQKGLLGRNSWQKLIEYFETIRENEGLPLTYEIYYLYGKI